MKVPHPSAVIGALSGRPCVMHPNTVPSSIIGQVIGHRSSRLGPLGLALEYGPNTVLQRGVSPTHSSIQTTTDTYSYFIGLGTVCPWNSIELGF